MTLETERLVLRPLVLDDHPAIQKHFPHWDIVRYLAAKRVRWPYPDDGAYKFLTNIALPAMEKGEDWYWGILRKEDPSEIIGVIHLRRATESGNRSLWLSQEHQSKGYMTEALGIVTDYAFSELGFEKLVIKNAHENKASNRLKQKSGARLIEIIPTAVDHYIGGCREQEVWELTREAWALYKTARHLQGKPAAAFKKAAAAPKPEVPVCEEPPKAAPKTARKFKP